jgi:hypothetical protein
LREKLKAGLIAGFSGRQILSRGFLGPVHILAENNGELQHLGGSTGLSKVAESIEAYQITRFYSRNDSDNDPLGLSKVYNQRGQLYNRKNYFPWL